MTFRPPRSRATFYPHRHLTYRPPSDKLEVDTNNLPHTHPVYHRTVCFTSDSQLPVYVADYTYSSVRLV